MGVWYPSVIVNIELRFDEAFHVLEDDSPKAESSTSVETGHATYFGPATVRPLVLSGQKDQLSQLLGRIPKTASVELNGLRQAHTFHLTFDFRDIPIDPRLIRDARVEIFLGVVQPQDFARGMVKANQDGSRDSVANTQQSKTQRTNLLLVGMLDDPEVEHGPNGSTVTMTGRDLRGVLLDVKADPRLFRDIDLTKPIDDVIRQILAKIPYGKNINVLVQPQEWPDQKVPSPGVVGDVTRVRKGADGKQNPLSSPQGPGDKQAFWDIITTYCNRVGAVPFFVGKDLQVRPVRSLYQQINFDGTRPTPFSGGQQRTLKVDGKTEKIPIRRFVYGRDIATVRFKRKTRGTKVPVIECWSIDTSSTKRGLQKVISARWPDNTTKDPKAKKKIDAALKTSVAPSGQVSQTEILRFPMPGIASKQVLTNIAQSLYEELGRNEIDVAVSTHDFASFNTDDDQDPDMLTLMPGDAIQIVTDKRVLQSRNPLVSELSDLSRMSFSEAVSAVSKRLGKTGDDTLARALVATARGSIVELQDTFRTKLVRYTLSEGGAVGIDFEAENYIEVRAGAINPKIQQTTKKPTGATTSRKPLTTSTADVMKQLRGGK